MGRHSASFIAAQQGRSAGPAVAGAAKYVGGVGAVALSLWAAAAVAGSGLANADDSPAAKGPAADGANAVKSTLHSIAGSLRHGLPDGSAADGTSGVKLPKPGLFTLPKSTDNGGNALTGPLSGLAARVPHQFASSEPAAKGSSLRSAQPSAGLSAAAPVLSAAVDAVRGGIKPLDVTAFGAADPVVATTPVASLKSFAPAVAPQAAPSIATVPSGFLTALGVNSLTNTGGSPIAPGPAPVMLGALQLLRRETEQANFAQPASLTSIGSLLNPMPTPVVPASPAGTLGNSYASTDPEPTDVAYVPGVGDVGKYMLESDGSVSNYGGQTYGGKTMVEPVNVIIVDPTSTTPAQATAKLNKDMTLGGFPPQAVHSGGFEGLIGTKTYGQKPGIPLTAYSDNLFILQNDHGRIFGPAPIAAADGGGYVWTGTFSTETLGVSENGIPGHVYVSDDAARDALILRLLASGQVKSIDYVPLNNAIDPSNPNYTSGDHDGYAVVITLK